MGLFSTYRVGIAILQSAKITFATNLNATFPRTDQSNTWSAKLHCNCRKNGLHSVCLIKIGKPGYFFLHLKYVVGLNPASRQTSPTILPSSACSNINAHCASVIHDAFIANKAQLSGHEVNYRSAMNSTPKPKTRLSDRPS